MLVDAIVPRQHPHEPNPQSIEEAALANPWDENSISAVQSQGYGMQRR